MVNPFPPNTYKWKLFEDFNMNQTAPPPAPPAPGGKPQRQDLRSQINGSNTIFVLSSAPNLSELQVVFNGQNMDSLDFQLSGSNLLTTPGLNGPNTGFTPKVGDSFFVIY